MRIKTDAGAFKRQKETPICLKIAKFDSGGMNFHHSYVPSFTKDAGIERVFRNESGNWLKISTDIVQQTNSFIKVFIKVFN